MVNMKRRSICEEEKGSDHGDPDTSEKDNDIEKQRIKIVLDSLSQAVSGLLDSMAVSPINVIKTINVIPTINVIKINHKCNTNHKCNNF